MAGFEPAHPFARAFLRELRDRGYVEGKNFIFERRSLEGHPERGPEVMAELLRLKTDVIVVPINDVLLDAKRVTSTVPIVMVYSNSPVEAGLVASLARPGGNVTGLMVDAGPEMEAKRLELLKAALAWGIVGIVTLFVFIGLFVLGVAAMWFLYRAIKGWMELSEGKAMYGP